MTKVPYAIECPWFLEANWLDKQRAAYWMKNIHTSVHWSQPYLLVYGRSYLSPRLIGFLGDQETFYKYSGMTHIGKGWPEWFLPLLSEVKTKVGVEFNACLFNLYRNGTDSMGWHSDNEKQIDCHKPIASLSLGITRDFMIKHKYLPIKNTLRLSNGDLLIMKPGSQQDWLHCLPKRKKQLGMRINLTFRCII